mmetsp:Transcript_91823/g.264201  ORF Transcript_91823/g.264201 Transcript_91823/m.264201 type:complete len:201 (-) Transcript_91823:588-1190(-)
MDESLRREAHVAEVLLPASGLDPAVLAQHAWHDSRRGPSDGGEFAFFSQRRRHRRRDRRHHVDPAMPRVRIVGGVADPMRLVLLVRAPVDLRHVRLLAPGAERTHGADELDLGAGVGFPRHHGPVGAHDGRRLDGPAGRRDLHHPRRAALRRRRQLHVAQRLVGLLHRFRHHHRHVADQGCARHQDPPHPLLVGECRGAG